MTTATTSYLLPLIEHRIERWEARLKRAQTTVERGHIHDAIRDLQDIVDAMEVRP